MSVDDVEAITGLDFFYQLPDDEEELIESSVDISKWNLKPYTGTKAENKTLIESTNKSTSSSHFSSQSATSLMLFMNIILGFLVDNFFNRSG